MKYSLYKEKLAGSGVKLYTLQDNASNNNLRERLKKIQSPNVRVTERITSLCEEYKYSHVLSTFFYPFLGNAD